MSDAPYTKREIDAMFTAQAAETKNLRKELLDEQHGILPRIEVQTIKHNGRMTRVERALLIVGTIVAVLLITNGSELTKFLTLIV